MIGVSISLRKDGTVKYGISRTLQYTGRCTLLGRLWNSRTIISDPPDLASWGTKEAWRESHSTFLSEGTRYCLIPVSSLQRELSSFSDKNFVLFILPSFLAPPPTFLSLSFVDIKAGGRKREESSYRSRVRERKRERQKKVEKRGRQSGDLKIQVWRRSFVLSVKSSPSSGTFPPISLTMQ